MVAALALLAVAPELSNVSDLDDNHHAGSRLSRHVQFLCHSRGQKAAPAVTLASGKCFSETLLVLPARSDHIE